MSTHPIDIVIPWVDGSDPVWQADHAKYRASKSADNHPARYRAQNRAGNTVFILYRFTVSNRYVTTFLARCFYRFFNRCSRNHLRILRAAV